ncbi:MAG: DUF501 domain-containing protein [Actinobacteria bacterium]|nr:DUF501 domain-containing protein [Actinomycetota bacterium]
MISPVDRAAIEAQLDRPIRGALDVSHRCSCGQPNVVLTAPRLPDGTPFPTTFYLTCPKLTGAIGTLEANGVMRELQDELESDPELAAHYQQAHEHYLTTRAALGEVPEIAGISAGGMPNRVKCLHVLVGHSLAAGPGVNPLGDRVLAMLGDWAKGSTCAGDAKCG